MIINLSYCSASLGREVFVDYDDVAHTLVLIQLNPPGCFPGLTWSEVIYTHTVGLTVYEVRVINAEPYAEVNSYSLPACSAVIGSVAITNSSTEISNNGAINVTAYGNGVLSYSIDGIAWQASNIFNGLSPGSYTARVRNLFNGAYCYATQVVVVGYAALSVCDLVLGNVSTTPGPGGTISVINYATIHTSEPVEYRLGAGAWQAGSVFTGLASGTYSVQIRFKNFTGCFHSRNVTLSACTLQLVGVNITHEQSKYADDGTMTILVSSGSGPYQYSINDGGIYQVANIFIGLSPGVYLVRVKDAALCEVFLSVKVLPYKKAVVVFPIANAHRVIITDGPVKDNGPQNFDNTLFHDMRFPGREKECFQQPFSTADFVPLQWRSSYGAHVLRVYNKLNVLQATLAPIKRTSYMGFGDVLNANFSDYGAGKTQVWFPDGMQSFLEVGMDVTIAGQATLNGTYEIEDIVVGTGNAVGFQSLIVSRTYTSGTDPLTGTIAVTYNLEDYEVWEIMLDMAALAPGEYYLTVSGSDGQFAPFMARSEPYQVTVETDWVTIQSKNIDSAFLIDYGTGIEHLLRVDGELLAIEPGGEREVMEDSNRRVVKLREHVTRHVQLNVYDVPYWIVEKIKIALAHDVVKLNGVGYQPIGEVSMEQPAMDNLCSCSVKLRQVDFIAENSDDAGDVDGIVLGIEDAILMGLEP